MKTKHVVKDSRGKMHKRTSRTRVYTHAVVHHLPERVASWDKTTTLPPYSHAEWAMSERNAINAANRWRRQGIEVEIIPAVVL